MDKYSIKCKICGHKFNDKTSNELLLIHYENHKEDIVLRENFKRVSNV